MLKKMSVGKNKKKQYARKTVIYDIYPCYKK